MAEIERKEVVISEQFDLDIISLYTFGEEIKHHSWFLSHYLQDHNRTHRGLADSPFAFKYKKNKDYTTN